MWGLRLWQAAPGGPAGWSIYRFGEGAPVPWSFLVLEILQSDSFAHLPNDWSDFDSTSGYFLPLVKHRLEYDRKSVGSTDLMGKEQS